MISPPCSPAPGTDVDDVVGDANRLLVVLDDDHGVAEVAQPHEGLDQAPVVALVQPDRRFVEHVEHADEPAPDLRREPDALRFAAGERSRRAIQRQVVETDVEHELEALEHFLEHALGDETVALGQLDGLEERDRVGDRQLADLEDVALTDRDRERRRPQPRAAARGARHEPHVALDLIAHAIGVGLRVPALHPRHDTFVLRRVRTLPPVTVLVPDGHLLAAGAVEHDLLLRGLQLLPRCRRGESVLVADRGEHALEVLAPEPRPRRDRAVVDREIVVGHEQLGVDLELRAEAVAGLARAVRRVEREVARRELLERQPAVHAREVLGEHERLGRLALVVFGNDLDLGDAFGELQRGLERVGEPPLDPRPAHQPVDDDLDGVLLVALELELGGQVDDLTVDPGPGVTLAGELVEERVVLPLRPAHDRRQHLEPRAVGQLQHPVDDLLRRLAGDELPAVRAVRDTDPGVEQAEVVVDLGDRADRGPRVAGGRFLVDRDGRRQALDEVDVGLVHLAEELPGVRRQRLHVAALAFGVDGVERQR